MITLLKIGELSITTPWYVPVVLYILVMAAIMAAQAAREK